MVSGFFCGSNSLPREDDNDPYERLTRSAGSSPRKCRSSSKSSNKNPYSTRGLDKFSALLIDLEEKKHRIYSQSNPDEISLVRFVYSSDHDFRPIVVKSKTKSNAAKPKSDRDQVISVPSSPSMAVMKEEHKPETICKVCRKVNGFHWSQPKLYLPIIVILILVFLVLFGRSFTIMCTSIVWYALPTIANNNGVNSSDNTRRSLKKKDLATVRSFLRKN